MNERIKEFRFKAAEYANEQKPLGITKWNEMRDEKFAELIVDQMLAITDAHTEVFQTDRDKALIEHIKQSVKTHFGVEE